VLWEAVSQIKYYCSLKVKISVPPNFGLATQLNDLSVFLGNARIEDFENTFALLLQDVRAEMSHKLEILDSKLTQKEKQAVLDISVSIAATYYELLTTGALRFAVLPIFSGHIFAEFFLSLLPLLNF